MSDSQVAAVQAAIEYIERNISQEMVPAQIAASANLSLSQLYRLFSRLTGMTVKEYARLRRMAKAAVELRGTKRSVLDIAIAQGFSSGDAFTKSFVQHFGITPSKYRKTGKPVMLLKKKEILNDFIHKATHEGMKDGAYTALPVDIYKIFKPAHLWIAKVNREGWADFYEECEKRGCMQLVHRVPHGIRFGGGYLPQPGGRALASFGMEVSPDFSGDIPEGLELLSFPGSDYIVFNHPPYPPEDHGSVIQSLHKAIKAYLPEENGGKWDTAHLPVYEDDDKFGFTIAMPIKLE